MTLWEGGCLPQSCGKGWRRALPCFVRARHGRFLAFFPRIVYRGGEAFSGQTAKGRRMRQSGSDDVIPLQRAHGSILGDYPQTMLSCRVMQRANGASLTRRSMNRRNIPSSLPSAEKGTRFMSTDGRSAHHFTRVCPISSTPLAGSAPRDPPPTRPSRRKFPLSLAYPGPVPAFWCPLDHPQERVRLVIRHRALFYPKYPAMDATKFRQRALQANTSSC